jgi:hypothetical protein
VIDWVAMKPIIKSQIGKIANLPPAQVRWSDESEGSAWVADPSVYLRVKDVVGIGNDEALYSASGINIPSDQQQVTMRGIRNFTLQVRAESFTQDVTDPGFAGTVAEKIRIRLKRPSTQQVITGHFGIVRWLATNWLDYKSESRQISAYVIDILCVTADIDKDDSEDSGDWIGRVKVDSDPFKDVDGNPTPIQVHLDIDER